MATDLRALVDAPITRGLDAQGAPSLLLDGRPFRFMGLNAYYLEEEAARGRVDVVDETLGAAVRLGARVVRAWAFNDDPNKLETGIQHGRLEYREEGLRGVDLVLARARAFGLRLVLVLGDHWNSYGGQRQWLLWNGVADAVEGDARFWEHEGARAHYQSHVANLLLRRNTLTGLRWGDDPTVLAWELWNEPRGRGADGRSADPPDDPGAALARWTAFAARTVKAHARQLIATGDEGEDVRPPPWRGRYWRRHAPHLFAPATATAWRRHLAIPEVDLASIHLYPDKYGLDPDAARAWIRDHARLARAAGKPLWLGELGLAGRDAATHLAPLLHEARAAGLTGVAPWLYVYASRPRAWDEFSFGEDDEVARLVAAEAPRWRGDQGSGVRDQV